MFRHTFKRAAPLVWNNTRNYAKQAEVQLPIQLYGVSGQYSHCLFALASEHGKLEVVEKDFGQLKGALDSNPEINDIVQSPIVSLSARTPIIEDILKTIKADKLTNDFFGLLNSNGRSSMMSEVIADYLKLMKAHRRETTGTVTSAAPLSQADKDKLQKQVTDMIPFSVELNYKVDESLLQGHTVQIGSQFWDYTIKPINDYIKSEWEVAISNYYDSKIREVEEKEKSYDA